MNEREEERRKGRKKGVREREGGWGKDGKGGREREERKGKGKLLVLKISRSQFLFSLSTFVIFLNFCYLCLFKFPVILHTLPFQCTKLSHCIQKSIAHNFCFFSQYLLSFSIFVTSHFFNFLLFFTLKLFNALNFTCVCFQVYSDWCHEFEKYKLAMKTWERKQAVSTLNLHPRPLMLLFNIYLQPLMCCYEPVYPF